MKKIVFLFVIGVCLIVAAVLVACSSAAPQPTQAPAATQAPAVTQPAPAASVAPALDGATVLQKDCTSCHGLDKISSKKLSRQNWEQEVNDMISEQGAKVSADEMPVLLDYLAKTYGQ